MRKMTQLELAIRSRLKRISFKRTLPHEFGGYHIYASPGSDWRFLTANWTSAYDELLDVCRRFIHDGDCVWDIGANIGVFTFSALGKIGSNGRVICVEPDPELSSLILRSKKLLGESNSLKITLLTAAVADNCNILELVVPYNGSARNHLSGVEGNQANGVFDRRACVAVTIDWLSEHLPVPNFIKIDVEGAELLVISGAKSTIQTHKPGLYIEVNDTNASDVTSILTDCGYQFFIREAGQWQPSNKCGFNTLALHKDNVYKYVAVDRL